MARLFTAIELSGETRAALATRQAEIAAALPPADGRTLSRVRDHQLHLTLVFLGEVGDERVPAVAESVSEPIDIAPFRLEFGPCGVFPPGGAPRVLWLGVTTGAGHVLRLYDVVSARLERLGFARERRTYHPHLTLGRWRDGASRAVRKSLPASGWSVGEQVTQITLFRSRLSPHGAEHTVVAHGPLLPAPGRNV